MFELFDQYDSDNSILNDPWNDIVPDNQNVILTTSDNTVIPNANADADPFSNYETPPDVTPTTEDSPFNNPFDIDNESITDNYDSPSDASSSDPFSDIDNSKVKDNADPDVESESTIPLDDPFDYSPEINSSTDDTFDVESESTIPLDDPFNYTPEINSSTDDTFDVYSLGDSFNQPETINDWFSDIFTIFSDTLFPDTFRDFPPFDSLVDQDQFIQNSDGSLFDDKNGLIVEGNVQQDIDFISQQTHSSCSLMAQEQFVARYYGESVSESLLEKLMSSYGVYDPENGTVYEGQTMVLDTFNIPYERNNYASIDDLVNELNSDHDCIIGVDARYFYNDPNIPPWSGHAVTVVGKGIDPVSNEIKGFYITDSNCPGAAHYIDKDRLSEVWYNDVISIPNPTMLA